MRASCEFVDDDGTVTYFATYTAFDGHQILPQLLETGDFMDFRVTTLRRHGGAQQGASRSSPDGSTAATSPWADSTTSTTT
jgi:hypothetical protein